MGMMGSENDSFQDPFESPFLTFRAHLFQLEAVWFQGSLMHFIVGILATGLAHKNSWQVNPIKGTMFNLNIHSH